jgi:IclR family acetate operon transcriptional repressor
LTNRGNGHIAERYDSDTDRTEIQSVARALSLLDALARAGGEATLSVLAADAGLNISTCHHLMATMMRRGYVAQGVGRRAYRIVHRCCG